MMNFELFRDINLKDIFDRGENLRPDLLPFFLFFYLSQRTTSWFERSSFCGTKWNKKAGVEGGNGAKKN